ncbi:Bodo-specific multi-copy gene family, putative [Bodo saltans]|uniref:Bodo-specific multi-copy gene family, putative n=1 Tax=Bodo saltans TaxID=75058 RepID=A0A0S4IYS3_BODSA|nr:Bodo-specific multi-copy gene family, putative [Bodo saltans]|eukprot:CUG11135.1 Bodo-specific multi-copy gene family, putative [Bodo saltans]
MMRVRRMVSHAVFPRRMLATVSTLTGIAAHQTWILQDPKTWPQDWTAADIKNAYEGLFTKQPNYESLALLLKSGDYNTLAVLLKVHCETPVKDRYDVVKYLNEYIDNNEEPADMKLQERDDVLAKLESALSTQPGSEKRNVAFSYSQRGSGKTQFLKYFVATRRKEALQYGRVIVRCCAKAIYEKNKHSLSEMSWYSLVLKDRAAQTTSPATVVAAASSSDEGLCELIRTHVFDVTGIRQDPSNYCDPKTAYATWMNETARHFNINSETNDVAPLIVLDTCELLGQELHNTLVHKSSTGKPYTLLEAFCLAVPSPHGIVVVGCNAQIASTDAVLLTKANVTNIGPLPPLSMEGYKKALDESWNSKIDPQVREPIFHWAGGLPRLLKIAEKKEPQQNSLASGSFSAFSRCFESYKASAGSLYPLQPTWFSQAYTSLLVSSTKVKVTKNDVIPINPKWKDATTQPLTYDEAVHNSIGSYIQGKGKSTFMVPPITFDDEMLTKLLKVMHKCNAPIMPSQLHPFLDGQVSLHFGKDNATERGRIFEKAFVYAVFARYLLAHWEKKDKWIPFSTVFEGAIHPKQKVVVQDYEVNLSEGVMELDGIKFYHDAKALFLTYLGGSSHHDAYIWCRKTSSRTPKG